MTLNTAQTKPDGSVWDFPPPIEVYAVVCRAANGKLTTWAETYPSREGAALDVNVSMRINPRTKCALSIIPVRLQALQRVLVKPSGGSGA